MWRREGKPVNVENSTHYFHLCNDLSPIQNWNDWSNGHLPPVNAGSERLVVDIFHVPLPAMSR